MILPPFSIIIFFKFSLLIDSKTPDTTNNLFVKILDLTSLFTILKDKSDLINSLIIIKLFFTEKYFIKLLAILSPISSVSTRSSNEAF